MLLGIERHSCRSSLGALVDLLDQSIDGFAGLDGHIFFLFQEEGVELVEEIGVMFGTDEIPFENFQDEYFFLGGMLTFVEGGEEVADDPFLEA